MSEWQDVPEQPETDTGKHEKVSAAGVGSIALRLSRIRWQFFVMGAGLLLIAIAGLFMLLSPSAITAPPPELVVTESQIFTEALVGQALYVNPLLATSQTDRDLASLVYSGLTRVDQYGQPVPDLAESWSVSEDGLTYIFTLRRDATWHDGVSFTAHDVDFTMRLLRDPDFPGDPALGAFWRTIETYADDDYTVRFVLTQPLSAFPEYAGIGILPEHWLENIPAEELPNDLINLDPIGTGSLDWISIEDQEDHQFIRLQPYPQFYDASRRVGLDEIHFLAFENANRAYRALGPDAMALSGLTPAQQEAIFESDWLNIHSSRLPVYGTVLFNQGESGPSFLKDADIRHALVLAIDRSQILTSDRLYQYVPAHTLVLPGTWAYAPCLESILYDPAQAELILNQEGWERDGDTRTSLETGETLTFNLLVNDDPFEKKIGESLVAQWSALGIQVQLEVISATGIAGRLQARNFDAVLVEFNQLGAADPDPYAFWHDSQIEGGQNFSGVADRDISEALEIARRDPNGVRRAELYREFQTLFIERGIGLVLYTPMVHYAVSCQVQNAQVFILRDPSDRFNTLHDWSIASGDELEKLCP